MLVHHIILLLKPSVWTTPSVETRKLPSVRSFSLISSLSPNSPCWITARPTRERQRGSYVETKRAGGRGNICSFGGGRPRSGMRSGRTFWLWKTSSHIMFPSTIYGTCKLYFLQETVAYRQGTLWRWASPRKILLKESWNCIDNLSSEWNTLSETRFVLIFMWFPMIEFSALLQAGFWLLRR